MLCYAYTVTPNPIKYPQSLLFSHLLLLLLRSAQDQASKTSPFLCVPIVYTYEYFLVGVHYFLVDFFTDAP